MFGDQSKTCLLYSALYHVRLALLYLVNYVGMLSTSLYTTYYLTRWLIAIADIYTEYIGHRAYRVANPVHPTILLSCSLLSDLVHSI